jgi:vacuolar-type H+-ATPase subunit I/STV1
MRLLFIITMLPLVFMPIIHAQDMPDDIMREQQQIDRMMHEEDARFLEELKKEHPEAYSHHIQMREKQQRIQHVVQAFSNNQISEDDACNKIRSLIADDINIEQRAGHIDEEIHHIKMHIGHLEKELRRLQAIKNNPDLIIEEQVNSYLGISREYY